MLFQKGRKKEDKLDTVRKVKIRCKNRLFIVALAFVYIVPN